MRRSGSTGFKSGLLEMNASAGVACSAAPLTRIRLLTADSALDMASERSKGGEWGWAAGESEWARQALICNDA